MLYNERYILLRGHQETFLTTEFRVFLFQKERLFKFLFQDQILHKFPGASGEDIWQKFKMAFSLMPAAAVVGDKILCVHGGITADVKNSVDEWRKIPKTDKIETINQTIRELIFSCPIDDGGAGAEPAEPIYFTSIEKANQTRLFNEAAVKEFCDKTKIELIVRSHEIFTNGFRFFADKRMITIFSTTVHQNTKNKATFLRVDAEGVVSIIQLRPTEKKAEDKTKKKNKTADSVKKTEENKTKESKEKTKDESKEEKQVSKEEKQVSKEEKQVSKEEKQVSKESVKKEEKKKTNASQSREIESFFDNENEN
uniref:SER_THR_PHOSPHATASE domain-containing protein n=1 Tax=Caenorhabditis tropicalis TaxID=1561998 RepID=A0A1I7V083_9PELO